MTPTDAEIDEVIDTALAEGTPRYKVRRQLRALFDTGARLRELNDAIEEKQPGLSTDEAIRGVLSAYAYGRLPLSDAVPKLRALLAKSSPGEE